MNKNTKFEILVSLVMLVASNTLALISVSLFLPTLTTIFFISMEIIFLTFIIIDIRNEK